MRALLALLVVSACDGTQPPPAVGVPSPASEPSLRRVPGEETEGNPTWELELSLAGGAVLRQSEAGVWLDDQPVALDPGGPVAVDAARARFVVVARVDGGPEAALLACAPPEPCRTLAQDGSPDRVALSDDGRTVAWVASADGLPAVFVAPFDGGPAVQLTNRGLARPDGGPPPGFVPPPHLEPLRFADGALTWDSADGPHRAALP